MGRTGRNEVVPGLPAGRDGAAGAGPGPALAPASGTRRGRRAPWARGLAAAVLVGLGLSLLPVTGGFPSKPARAATSIDELKRQIKEANDTLEDLERQQAEAERKLRALRKDEAAIQERIAILEDQIRVTRVKLAELSRQVQEAEEKVEAKREEIDRATRRLEEREEYVGKRIRAIHENGTVGVLEVLFEASSFADFLTRLDLLSQILRHDLDVMAAVKAERERLVAEKNELEQERRKLVALKQGLQAEERRLNATIASHRVELRELEKRKAEAAREAQELARDSQRVEAMLKSLEGQLQKELSKGAVPPPQTGSPGSGSTGGGRFAWPVPGYYSISSYYGWREIFGYRSFHAGIDIPAPGPRSDDYCPPPVRGQTPVVAAESGRVVWSGCLGAYGHAVIIQHDGTFSTLYGHLSWRAVQKDQTVSRGQVIGTVGDTGRSTGPHLHFEVRVKGEAQNPLKYVSR